MKKHFPLSLTDYEELEIRFIFYNMRCIQMYERQREKHYDALGFIFILVLLNDIRIKRVSQTKQGLADSFTCAYHRLYDSDRYSAYHSTYRSLKTNQKSINKLIDR